MLAVNVKRGRVLGLSVDPSLRNGRMNQGLFFGCMEQVRGLLPDHGLEYNS